MRGRSGRQGDPGEAKFYLGMDDDLVKIFGGDIMSRLFDMGNIDENMPIEVKIVSNQIENAQSKVEGRNFSIRKHILSYDDVMNIQRNIIYDERRKVLDGEDMHDNIRNMIESSCEMVVDAYESEFNNPNFNKEALENEIKTTFNLDNIEELKEEKISAKDLLEELTEKALEAFDAKEKEIGSDIKELERIIVLKVVDSKWMEHIDSMDALKNGIGLRAYGQKDPVVQYRLEGGQMFDEMIAQIKLEVTKFMLHVVKTENKIERQSGVKITSQGLDNSIASAMNVEGESAPKTSGNSKPEPIKNEEPKVGRNDPCPCGSGKKYKNCCGKN